MYDLYRKNDILSQREANFPFFLYISTLRDIHLLLDEHSS